MAAFVTGTSRRSVSRIGLGRRQLALLVACSTAQLSPASGASLRAASVRNSDVHPLRHSSAAVSLLAIAHNSEIKIVVTEAAAPTPAPNVSAAAPAVDPSAAANDSAALKVDKLLPGTATNAAATEANASETVNNASASKGSTTTKSSDISQNSTVWALNAQNELDKARDQAQPCNTTAEVAPYAATPAPPVMIHPLEQSHMQNASGNASVKASQNANCVLSDWQNWEQCAFVKGSLTESWMEKRTRYIVNPPQLGGQECLPLSQSRACSAAGTIATAEG